MTRATRLASGVGHPPVVEHGQEPAAPERNRLQREKMELSGLKAALRDRAIADEPMSSHTTFGIGGPADLFVVVHTLPELRDCVQLACQYRVPYFILGSGANILVSDKGIRGLVVQNLCTAVSFSPQEDSSVCLVRAESGALIRDVAAQAIAQGLAGLEWAVDVPGTVGGAVVGNAGAFGGYTSDNLQRALVFVPSEGERWMSRDELELGYRTSILKRQRLADFPWVVLAAVFALIKGDPAQVQARAAQYSRRRAETQPSGRSAGSVFKRTPQYPAGFLIENAGLKGARIGDAIVSPQHANFIINLGSATAQDVRQLIDWVRNKVYAQFKIMLELEIELVGEW